MFYPAYFRIYILCHDYQNLYGVKYKTHYLRFCHFKVIKNKNRRKTYFTEAWNSSKVLSMYPLKRSGVRK